MKIKISSVSDKNFYEEFLNVIFNIRSISKNGKFKNSIFLFRNSLIVSSIVLIPLLIWCFLVKDVTLIILSCMVVFIFILSLFANIRVGKYLKVFLNNHDDSEFTVDDDGIELKKKGFDKVKIKWDSLDFIFVGKVAIVFVSNDKKTAIGVPMEYYSKFKSSLKKYKKDIRIIER